MLAGAVPAARTECLSLPSPPRKHEHVSPKAESWTSLAFINSDEQSWMGAPGQAACALLGGKASTPKALSERSIITPSREPLRVFENAQPFAGSLCLPLGLRNEGATSAGGSA